MIIILDWIQLYHITGIHLCFHNLCLRVYKFVRDTDLSFASIQRSLITSKSLIIKPTFFSSTTKSAYQFFLIDLRPKASVVFNVVLKKQKNSLNILISPEFCQSPELKAAKNATVLEKA